MATGIQISIEKGTLIRMLLEMNSIASFIYPMSLAILFCLLCSIVSDQLSIVTKSVRKILNDGTTFQLKELQNEHARISLSINLINRLFGPFLFLDISYIFISGTVYFVYVMVASQEIRFWTFYFLIFSIALVNFLNLVLVSLSADNIKFQVSFHNLFDRCIIIIVMLHTNK